jgi:hypothetical protein
VRGEGSVSQGMPCSASLAEIALEIDVKCTSAAPCPGSGETLPISPNWQKRSESCFGVVSSEMPATWLGLGGRAWARVRIRVRAWARVRIRVRAWARVRIRVRAWARVRIRVRCRGRGRGRGRGRVRVGVRRGAGHLQVARRAALDGAHDARVERLRFGPVEVEPLLLQEDAPRLPRLQEAQRVRFVHEVEKAVGLSRVRLRVGVRVRARVRAKVGLRLGLGLSLRWV